jgi:Fe-S cluster assembly iron-binding protein IscA
MDIELVNVINYLKSLKQDLYKKYKPEMVDGKTIIANRNQPQVESECEHETHSKTYIKLLAQQRQILYGANVESKEKASKHIQELTEQLDGSEEKVKISVRCTGSHQFANDLCKPWNKIPTNLKIQSILKFIDSLVPKLSDEQKNQMRYLLISAISQKKLYKQTDVDYDTNKGYIIKINKLSYDGKLFTLLNEDDSQEIAFDFSVHKPEPPKKKLILIKK